MFRSASQGVSARGRGVEHLVRGEQDERLALRLLEVVGDRPDRRPLELAGLVGGVGQVPGQVDRHLVGVVERAAQREGLGRGQARAAP